MHIIRDRELKWDVLSLFIMASVTVGIVRDGLPALFPFIQAEFNLTRAEVGLFSTFLFSSSTILAVYTGQIVDYFGSRNGLITGILISGISLMLYAFMPSFFLILMLSIISGLGFSMISPSTSKGVLAHISYSRRATAMGFVQSGIGVGSLTAAAFLPVLGEHFSWRFGMLLLGIAAILIAAIIRAKYQDKMDGQHDKNKGFSPKYLFRQSMQLLLNNKYLRNLCMTGFMFAAVYSVINFHLVLYLHHDLYLSPTISAWGFGFFHLGGIFGRFGWGVIIDRFFLGSRRKGLFACGIFTSLGLFLLPLIGVNVSLVVLFLLVLYIGFALVFFGIYMVALSEAAGYSFTGLAVGLGLMWMRVSIMIHPPVMGYIADLYGDYRLVWVIMSTILLVFSILLYRHSAQFEK